MEQMAALLEARRKVDDGYDRINQALGREMGDPWEQPSSQNPYILNWECTHNGDEWVSNVPVNVWEPGVAGWDKKQAEVSPGELPAWDPDYSYEVGSICTRDGHVWKAKVAHGAAYQGTWGPSAATHGVWEDLGPIEDYIKE